MFNFVQKLEYYPQKVKAFQVGEYTETLSTVLLYLSAGLCNQDCIYCDKNFYDIHASSFNREQLMDLLDDMVELGADSLIILGEGAEPLLHPDLAWLINRAADYGIHCGIYTNGSVWNDKIVLTFNRMEFLRISLDAGTAKTHSKIHGYPASRKDFAQAIDLLQAIDKKSVNVGVVYIIMEENVEELYSTWKLLNEIGVHYLELKLALEENYQFGKVHKNVLEILKKQLDLIQEDSNPVTEIILNNHLRIFLENEGDVTTLTQRDETSCLTSVFRVIVSPLGYFLCSPLKNRPEAQFGNPFKERLIEAWRSEEHLSMIGRQCEICCTYYKQNDVLLQLKGGSGLPELPQNTKGQRHFL